MYGKHSTDFITQKCPYVLGSDTSQAGAGELASDLASDLFLNILLIQLYLILPNVEANFDLPVETTSQTSSSGHSPLPSPLIRSGQERDGGDNALVWRKSRLKPANVDSSLCLYCYLHMYIQVEIPSAPVPHTPPSILLNPKPSITAGDFEKKWIAMPKM